MLLHLDRNFDKCRPSLANYLLFFSLKSQKNVEFAMWCEISIEEVRLRFNLVQKYCSAITELRCASTESKSSLQKLRCTSENKKFKLRNLCCAFTDWKDHCAFDIVLLVPTSAIY